MLQKIRSLLSEPRLKDVNYDSDDLIQIHRKILMDKPMIREVFEELYRECRQCDDTYLEGTGARIELGAGSSFFRELYPDIISTDIKHGGHLDRVLDAQAMDLADASVRSFYAIHCFHHLPRPELFFSELLRVLVPGGGCVLIEPYSSPVAAWFFKRMFATETYDKKQTQWETNSTGVMVGANQALSYIVFRRDRARFEAEFPGLEIVNEAPLPNYLRYLLSGGINFRSLAPGACVPVFRAAEHLLKPFNRQLALHHVIVLKKRPSLPHP